MFFFDENSWIFKRKNDKFYLKAKKFQYRSRAVFKLFEIQEKYNFLKNNMSVVDFGSSPGGWSEFALKCIGKSGYILSIDRFVIENIFGVDFINGDINNKKFFNDILYRLGSKVIDVVISDVSPYITGNKIVDMYNVFYLANIILIFSKKKLKFHGSLLIKLFYGENFDFYLKFLKNYFLKIYVIKPKSSIMTSLEVYVFCENFSIV